MVITTKENTVEIRLTTRSMAVFEEKFGIKDSIQFWKRAAAGPNVKILATALFTFSKEVSSLDDAFDLIDECRTEGKTIYELYEELIQEANGGGFSKNLHRRGAEGGNESTGARSGTDCELCGEYYGEGCNNWRGLIAAIRPEAYKCGVKPLEFQEMSLFEVHEYIEAYHERQKDKFRYEAILLSGLASQVINAFSQQPKNLTLKRCIPNSLKSQIKISPGTQRKGDCSDMESVP